MQIMTIPATVENLDKVIAFVDQQLERFQCPMETQFQIDVAVEEIYVNIAHYAYTPGEGEATIRCEVEEGPPVQVVIELLDNGVPYDPLAKADPDVTLSAEELKAIAEYHRKKGEKIPIDSRHALLLAAEKAGVSETEALKAVPSAVAALGFATLELREDGLYAAGFSEETEDKDASRVGFDDEY